MRQSFIITIALIAAIIFVVVFLITPLYDTINIKKTEIKEKEEITAALQVLAAKSDQWREIFTQEKDNIARANLALPGEKNVSDLIVSLDSLAGLNGIDILSINVKDVAQKRRALAQNVSAFEVLEVSLLMRGTYPVFKSFLSDMEKNIRIIDVQSINFKPSGEGDPINLDFTVNLAVYYR